MARDRTYYAQFSKAELRRMIDRVSDRATRAETDRDYLIDLYQWQEMTAALTGNVNYAELPRRSMGSN